MIEKIKNGLMSSDEQCQQDSIYLIGYAFEKFGGLDDGDIPVEVNNTEIDKNIVADLKEMLINYLTTNPNESNRASVFNALRKSFDESLKGLFVEALKKEVDDSAIVLFQIMLALSDIGENCFGGRQSLSEFDVEENIALAKKYLTR